MPSVLQSTFVVVVFHSIRPFTHRLYIFRLPEKRSTYTHTQLRSQSRKSLQKKYYYLFFWWRKIRFENFLCDECAQAVWVSVCFVGHARDWGKGAASFWMCGGDATVRPVPVCRADVSNNAILWSIPRVRACLSSVAAHTTTQIKMDTEPNIYM